MIRLAVFGLFFILSTKCHGIELTSVIETDKGPVQGVILETVWNAKKYSAFKGIRYAMPPINSLRFKPPIEAEPWTETLNATQEGSVCTQLSRDTDQTIGSEDCLYLNVFTPETNFDIDMPLKPVMVWIHGGGYITGSGNVVLYGPDFFLEEDVVIVTLNYRLGVLGFLALQHKDAMGNAGLKDQTLALKWVQQNIANFGGDPDQVTIFGQSAGGSSVSLHVLSDYSRGLFHRSISMSGTALCTWAFSSPMEASKRAFRLASLFNYEAKDTDDLLHFLQNTPADAMVKATTGVTQIDPQFKPSIELPNEQEFLTECPLTKIQSGKFNQHPHMLGFTKDEVLSFTEPATNWTNFIEATSKVINDVYKKNPHKNPIAQGWFSNLSNILKMSSTKDAIALLSNILFVAPIDLTRKLLHSHTREPTYYYRVSYETEYSIHKQVYNISMNGTAHSDDVGYIFHVPAVNAPVDPNHPFNQFRKRMVKLWTNFAKYGDPTPRGEKDSLLEVFWRKVGLIGWQLDIDEKFVLKTPQIDYSTLLYETILYAALPYLTGCLKMLNYISKLLN